MSGKSNLRQFQNIVNGDMSQATVTSAVTCIQWLDNIGIQLTWTGAAVGTFAVEVSADYAQDIEGNVQVAGNWTALSLSPAPVAAGVANTIYVDINGISAPWIRIKYTKTSSTGTLQGYITGKSV